MPADTSIRSAVLVLIALLVGCTGSSDEARVGMHPVATDLTTGPPATAPATLAEAAPGGFELPAPSTLLKPADTDRTGSYLPEDLIREGSQFDQTLPFSRVTIAATDATFAPQFAGAALGESAFAIYHFEIVDYDRNAEVRTGWIGELPAEGNLWIGLSNWELNRWNFFKPATGSSSVFPPAFEQFFDFGGDLLVVVLVLGSAEASLDGLRIGSEAPTAVIDVQGDSEVMQRATVVFNASSSSDPDGTIEKFEWDFGGDGTFETESATGVIAHTYDLAGEFNAAVRVTDDAGLSATGSTTVSVQTGWIRTIGGASADSINAVAISAEGDIWACGTIANPDGPGGDRLLVKYSAAGDLLLQKRFNTGGETYHAFHLGVASDGQVFVGGNTSEAFESGGSFFQRCDVDGEPVWTIVLDQDDTGNLNAMRVSGTTLFLAGEKFLVDGPHGNFFIINGSGGLQLAKRTVEPCEFSDLQLHSVGFISFAVFAGTTVETFESDLLFAKVDLDDHSANASTWGDDDKFEEGVAIQRAGGSQALPDWALAFDAEIDSNSYTGLIKPSSTDTVVRGSGLETGGVALIASPTQGHCLIANASRPLVFISDASLALQADYGFSESELTVARCAAPLNDMIVVGGSSPRSEGVFNFQFNPAEESLSNVWTNFPMTLSDVSVEVVDLSAVANAADQSPLVQDSGGGDRDCWISVHLPPQA